MSTSRFKDFDPAAFDGPYWIPSESLPFAEAPGSEEGESQDASFLSRKDCRIHIALLPRDLVYYGACFMPPAELVLSNEALNSMPEEVPVIAIKATKTMSMAAARLMRGTAKIGPTSDPSTSGCIRLAILGESGVRGGLPLLKVDSAFRASWAALDKGARQWDGRCLLVFFGSGTKNKQHSLSTFDVLGMRELTLVPSHGVEEELKTGMIEQPVRWHTYWDFEVRLAGEVEPAPRRRFLLKYSSTFLELHQAIQDACGWEDRHLFQFSLFDEEGKEEVVAGPPMEYDDSSDDPEAQLVRLEDVLRISNSRLVYLYDFGDDWYHEIRLVGIKESTERFRRRLLGGERAFPPEDSGGIGGYWQFSEVALGIPIEGSQEAERERRERKEWLGDWEPDKFDFERAKTEFDK